MDNNSNFSTQEIKTDIEDTKEEIRIMTLESKALRIIGDRLSLFRADANLRGIKEREDFVEKLEEILKERI